MAEIGLGEMIDTQALAAHAFTSQRTMGQGVVL